MMYNSRATGNEKEALAADHLAGRGYEILCRNFRVASGEIDIVAKHDGYIVFIEDCIILSEQIWIWNGHPS